MDVCSMVSGVNVIITMYAYFKDCWLNQSHFLQSIM
jgi:hypothetical protein